MLSGLSSPTAATLLSIFLLLLLPKYLSIARRIYLSLLVAVVAIADKTPLILFAAYPSLHSLYAETQIQKSSKKYSRYYGQYFHYPFQRKVFLENAAGTRQKLVYDVRLMLNYLAES